MSKQIKVPDIGDFEKVEVIELLVKQGDKVNKNDSLITIESDKSSVEVPSTEEGTVENINVKIGDKVSKGDLILTLSGEIVEDKKDKISPVTEKIIQEAESRLTDAYDANELADFVEQEGPYGINDKEWGEILRNKANEL